MNKHSLETTDIFRGAFFLCKGSALSEIRIRNNGKGYFGLCPFHKDTNPSLSVASSRNEWQCLGCGAAGDVIRFVELFDKVSFPKAVSQLSGMKQLSAVSKK